MAEDGKVQASFPAPPACFYSQFTDVAVERGETLAPPAIPKAAYSCFGAKLEVNEEILRPLSTQGIHQLYPSTINESDRISEMRKLNFSILVNFLDLLNILIQTPNSPQREEKVNDISLLFINLHHLINEYRPHQARETIRVMMELQRTRRLDAIRDIEGEVKKVRETLERCAPVLTSLQPPVSSSATASSVSVDARLGQDSAGQSSQGTSEAPMDTGNGDAVRLPGPGSEPAAKLSRLCRDTDRREECSNDIVQLCQLADLIT